MGIMSIDISVNNSSQYFLFGGMEGNKEFLRGIIISRIDRYSSLYLILNMLFNMLKLFNF